MIYAIGTPASLVRQYLSIHDDADVATQLNSGEVAITINAIPTTDQIISADGKSIADAPVDLDKAKAALWIKARFYRDGVAGGVCSTPSGFVQIDDASKIKINTAAMSAILAKSAGSSYSINWTMADNSIVALDADQMIAVATAVGQFLSDCQKAGTAIRASIEAATMADAVAALDITAGYPS